MGINCEIKIFKQPDGAFKPGSNVSGVLKYTINEETVFNKIIISFKGNGYLILKHKQRENNLYSHRKSEDYVDIDYVVHMNQSGERLAVKSYETQFNFALPENIPPTFKYTKVTTKFFIQCFIQYYIRIKFERPGMIKSPKKFRKEINVISLITPKLSIEPTVYGDKKLITQMFTKQKGVIDARAVIEKSVVMPGEKIKFDCELKNETKHTIRAVTTHLVAVHSFNAKGNREETFYDEIKDSVLTTPGISIGQSRSTSLEITIPSKASCVENSNLVSRAYFIMVTVDMRVDRHVVLKVPLQIGDEIQGTDVEDVLPSYWEVMLEDDLFHSRRFSNRRSSEESN